MDSEKIKKAGSWGAAQAGSLFEEFRRFALKGNVVDLSLGVIIGAAFAKVTDSLVKNIIMPVLSLLLPTHQGYVEWKISLDGKTIPYGQFLGDILNFFIVSFALFLFVVKFLGWVAHRRVLDQPAPTKEQELLREIRDLLRERKQS